MKKLLFILFITLQSQASLETDIQKSCSVATELSPSCVASRLANQSQAKLTKLVSVNPTSVTIELNDQSINSSRLQTLVKSNIQRTFKKIKCVSQRIGNRQFSEGFDLASLPAGDSDAYVTGSNAYVYTSYDVGDCSIKQASSGWWEAPTSFGNASQAKINRNWNVIYYNPAGYNTVARKTTTVKIVDNAEPFLYYK